MKKTHKQTNPSNEITKQKTKQRQKQQDNTHIINVPVGPCFRVI